MRSSSIAPTIAAWASAYLGCALFLCAGVVPGRAFTPTLLAELSWLALLGSAPTALILGAATRAARGGRSIAGAVAVLAAIVAMAVAWEHTDLLLSGPSWALHARREAIRLTMTIALGGLGALGWLFVVAGLGRRDRWMRLGWLAVAGMAVTALAVSIGRYRAYDYSVAQLVFPAGALCGAAVHVVFDGGRGARVVVALALAGALFGAGSRLDSDWTARGEREIIAHSRAGSLVMLYVLPHVRKAETWSGADVDCTRPRPMTLAAPAGLIPEQRRNVILISVDALRKDVVGSEERGGSVTPELSRLIADGVYFDNATTTYPATLFAIGSAWTGWSPAELYLSPALPETIFTRSRERVDRQLVVLPDVGWFRLPIVAEFLASGIDAELARSDQAATDLLIEDLKAARRDGASVMAWIHYYAPHDPYQAHPSFAFGRGRRNAYLSEVAYFDAQLGRLLSYLKEDGWTRDTLIIFFSDHGEALGEKRYYGHHVYLNSWMVDVPLALWHEALPPSRRSVGVSVADIGPTVLHFLGLPQEAESAAQSLLSLDPATRDRPTFSEAFPVRGRALFDGFRLPSLDDETIRARLRGIRVVNQGYEPKGAITRDHDRLIHYRSANTFFAYERTAGSGEEPSSSGEAIERAAAARAELERWEAQQMRRIQCRLRFSAERLKTPRPR